MLGRVSLLLFPSLAVAMAAGEPATAPADVTPPMATSSSFQTSLSGFFPPPSVGQLGPMLPEDGPQPTAHEASSTPDRRLDEFAAAWLYSCTHPPPSAPNNCHFAGSTIHASPVTPDLRKSGGGDASRDTGRPPRQTEHSSALSANSVSALRERPLALEVVTLPSVACPNMVSNPCAARPYLQALLSPPSASLNGVPRNSHGRAR